MRLLNASRFIFQGRIATRWQGRPAHEFAGCYVKSAQADSASLLEPTAGGSLMIHRQATSRLDGLLLLLPQSTRWREWAVHESARAGIRGFVQIRGWQARRVL